MLEFDTIEVIKNINKLDINLVKSKEIYEVYSLN
jgi:hypothetical protein